MTKPQTALLSECIAAHGLAAHTKINRFRWVEVGKIAGVDPRTAKSLVDKGLLEMQANDNNHSIVALSSDLLASLVKESD
jgi:hypothetical protein